MTGSEDHNGTSLTSRVAALLRQGHTDAVAFGEALPAGERERTGTVDAWARGRGEEGQSYQDFQPLNTESFPDLAANTWEQAMERSRESTEALIAAIGALPDGGLLGPARTENEFGTVSLLEMVVNNGYTHPQQHLADMSVARGEAEAAARIQRRALDALLAFDAGPEIAANSRYNLACALAASGPRAEVIALLREAFTGNPRLIAWARQDTDLDPLREDPGFQTLVAEGQA
jgi:hypothetical protein